MYAKASVQCARTRARVDVWEAEEGRWMEKSCFIPRASAKIHQPTTFTLLATTPSLRCDYRRLPFFGALNYRPELWNSGLERVYAGGLNTAACDPGGHERGGRCRDGRKFATGSLMSLKQKTPSLPFPPAFPPAHHAASRYRTFLPSFRPSFLRTLVYFSCCPSSSFVKRRLWIPPLYLFLFSSSHRALLSCISLVL